MCASTYTQTADELYIGTPETKLINIECLASVLTTNVVHIENLEKNHL